MVIWVEGWIQLRVYDLLRRKRDGAELSATEIRYLIDGYVAGSIPDYQMSALLMAIYFRGMTDQETFSLTQAMIDSGERLSFSALPGAIVDKHSTGGVGDKTTLVLIPLLAAAGVPVVKMSGRGLGHTGGTLDKLESFPGFRTELTLREMMDIVHSVGACIAGQTGNLTPADKKLYALRDVTATVESIPLIAASVMSKKLASGADALVLDVKYGSGAFMADVSGAERLAQTMVNLAKDAGKQAVALLTSMEQPLGYAVGNALEVKEAIATLCGEGPPDLVELVVALGAEMLLLSRRASGNAMTTSEARAVLRDLMENGRGLAKLRELVTVQGGDGEAVIDPRRLPQAPVVLDIPAADTGTIQSIDALEVGTVAMVLGAGRASQGAKIDLSVGLELTVKVGTHISAGEPIGRVHSLSLDAAQAAVLRIQRAVEVGDATAKKSPLVHSRIAST